MPEPDVLYEDNHLIIINKRPGDIVQGDRTGDMPLSETVKAYLKHKYNKPGNVFLGVVHRLDRPVSGAVIFAKTSKALRRLNEMLRRHEIKKTYLALVEGRPESHEGTYIDYLKKNPKTNKTTVFKRPTEGAKKAILHYVMRKIGDHYSLLEIDLKTGRHHQIRAQLAKHGTPVKGDLKYGARRSNPSGGIMLHAARLGFIHPVKKTPVQIIASFPEEYGWEIIEKLKNCPGK